MNQFEKIIDVDYTIEETSTVCEKHNVPTKIVKYITKDHTTIVSRCYDCQLEKRLQQRAEQIEEQKKINAARKQLAIEQITKNSKINSYAHATFESFDVSKQPDIYSKYYMYAYNIHKNIRSGKNIFARGATGRGKTHLAVAIAKVAIQNCYTVLFETLTAIELSLEDKDRKLQETIKVYCEVDLLIIDELTKINYPKTKQIFDDILEYRYSRRKPIIINTHLPMITIAQILDETRRSRLKQNCLEKPYVDFDKFYAQQDAESQERYDYRNIKHNNEE